MKLRLTIWLLLFTVLISCTDREPKFMSPSQIQEEEKLIIGVMKKYHKASEEKNFAMMVETLGDDLTFYGTDANEVIKSFADFQHAMNLQWEEYQKIHYGDMMDTHIVMDRRGKFASIIYGVPLLVTKDTIEQEYFVRIARTLEKEGGQWRIVSGIVGFVRDVHSNNNDKHIPTFE